MLPSEDRLSHRQAMVPTVPRSGPAARRQPMSSHSSPVMESSGRAVSRAPTARGQGFRTVPARSQRRGEALGGNSMKLGPSGRAPSAPRDLARRYPKRLDGLNKDVPWRDSRPSGERIDAARGELSLRRRPAIPASWPRSRPTSSPESPEGPRRAYRCIACALQACP
jgi:hypothetical protein